jgi:hypothetical protein
MADGLLQQAAMMKPPVNATETALTGTTQSGILALTGVKGVFYSFICTTTFNLNFSESATVVTEPSVAYVFAANTLYSFACSAQIKAFRAKSSADATLKWWRSTYA